MAFELQDKLEILLKAYSHHYDIYRDVETELTVYPAMAIYYLRDENYLISRKHVLSVVENYEYVYFLLADRLDAETLKKHIDNTLKNGMDRIRPHRQHMSSMVTLIILAGTIDEDAKRILKKTRYRKNFRLAFHGWMEYHIAATECSTNSFLSNPAGKEARKTLEANFGSGSV